MLYLNTSWFTSWCDDFLLV